MLVVETAFGVENKGKAGNEACSNVFCLPKDYDKLAAPFTESGILDIAFELEISQILAFDDIRFTVSILMYLNVIWEDSRIQGPALEDPTQMIPIDFGFVDSLWLPDVYIYDMKEIVLSKFNIPFAGDSCILSYILNIIRTLFKHRIIQSVLNISGLFLMNSSTVFYSQEAIITFWCPMRFQWYPLDNQICKFRIGSFAYDVNKMTFKTKRLTYDASAYNTILDYSVEILPLDEKDIFILRDGNKNYSVSGFEMRLSRHSLRYFLNYYLPSGLFVMVSWVCCYKFW